ncbi:MAG: hypothetical protein H6R26_1999, partial [Proteobacteria bacterium]|nr:hypothetical protein [Pseudomonadota bacterium]
MPIAANLHRIFGYVTGQRQEGALRLTQFQRGFILDDAITIFPSYTFPSQASFVMGTEPGVHGLPGNAIFDRMTKTNYGFDGSEKATYFVGQAMDVYYKELAGKLLQGDSIYSALLNATPPQRALSIFHQFRSGLQAEWYVLPDIIDQALFVPAATTHHYDRNATEELEKQLKRLPSPTSATLSRLSEWFSLIWLYLPGVDHYAHASERSVGLEQTPDAKVKVTLNSDTATKELSKYVGYIDPFLEKILDFLENYPGTIVMIVSDHGHTDTREAHDISWEPLRQVMGDKYNMWDTGKDIDNCDVVARLNSGAAHIYVNKVAYGQGACCGQNWNEKPDYWRVRAVASRFENYNTKWNPIPGLAGTPPYFDLILTRETARDGWNGPYYVYDPSQPDPFVDIRSYLRRTNNEFGARLGWSNTPQDIDFIADRINAMSCERSGDVVVLPHYPPPARLRKAGESYYHFTGADYASQHGSLSIDDMNMSFAVAQLGCPNPDNLLSVLRQTIANPARPRILDVSSTAAGFCGIKFRGKSAPSGAADVPAPAATHNPPMPPVTAPSAHTPPQAKPPAPPGPTPLGPVTADASRQTSQRANPELGQLASGAGKGQVTPEAEKRSWAQADQANGFREQGKLPEAKAAMLKALQHNPNAWYLWDGLSDLCLQDQTWPDAETALRAASRLAPNNGRLHLKLAQVLITEQKRDEAISEARQAQRLGAEGAKQVLEMLGVK